MKAGGLTMWLFGLLLRQRDREMILGDLVEERALLARSLSPRELECWYRSQMLRSIGPVMWANFKRGSWLKTLGAALVGYLVVALLVFASAFAMSKLMTGSEWLYAAVSLAVGIPVMVLGGYVAACMRPGAAMALAAITGVMGVVSLILTGDAAPIWYQAALIVIGPAASLAGGRIRVRRKGGERS